MYIRHMDKLPAHSLQAFCNMAKRVSSMGVPYTLPTLQDYKQFASKFNNKKTTAAPAIATTTTTATETIELQEINVQVESNSTNNNSAPMHFEFLQEFSSTCLNSVQPSSKGRSNLPEVALIEMVTIVRYCTSKLRDSGSPYEAIYALYLRSMFQQYTGLLAFARSICKQLK